MNRSSLPTLLAVALLAACKIGGGETTTTAGAACFPAGAVCGQSSDCCSYGCQGGLCVANPIEGGTCRTTNDCAFYRLCKSGACTTPTATMCRDDADVCSSVYQCCSGNCVGATWTTQGLCQPNHPPVAAFTVTGADANGNAPYRASLTLQNASTDPDGDTLYYTWAITARPSGSTAVLSSTSLANPTFTPDVAGDYAVLLTVVDGPTGQPGRLTASASQVFHAVNVPPVVSAGADRIASRNVALAVSGTVSDADGDPLTCTWSATPPGGGTGVVLAGPTSPCSGTFGATFSCTGTYTYPTAPASEGVWTITLSATDGPNVVAATAHVNCVNDAPTAQPGSDQVWNLGPAAGPNPTVPLSGGFKDVNGDSAYSWQWSLVTVPTGSTVTAGSLTTTTNGTTATASFVPDFTGRYVAQLQVCDRPSSCGTATTNIDVYRYVEDFGDHRVVNASDYAHAANKIAMAGPDPANAAVGKIWLRDPYAKTEVSTSSNAIDGVPDTVAVTAAGDWAVAGNNLWLWIVKLSVSPPTVTKITNPVGALGSIALAGTEALVFPRTGSGYFYHFQYTAATPTPVSAFYLGNVGRADPLGAYLYVLQSGSYGQIQRYAIGSKTGFSLTWVATEYLSYTPVYGFWVSQDGAHLFLGTGDIQTASTLTSTATSLGLAPAWVDSLLDGQAAAEGGDRLWLFNTGLTHSGDDLYPQWGVGGVGYVVTPDGGFIRVNPADTAKTIRYVLVHANGTSPFKSGLVTYP